ncbi:sulfite reductase subunit alpha [Stenotrophomonas sp. C3(2023)]|uniref:sulfite reductase subunit alpha n=1 Tax=Stenotrophomonas sp. C3(2023) TaxID=3080277 RepID=UPI00293C1A1B|nr:sulfite reductase subunit alpha [Stenotrophomonas sp. C3(2023)]MDV3467890.1 sulfite reductase subunit alpha [Stenotrophomonas sp. C3(2023)]
MSPRPSRATLGNVLVMLALLVIGALLLRLHLGDTAWWASPRQPAWLLASAALLVYAGFCLAVWWRGRSHAEAVDSAHPPLLLVWASQTGFALALAERSAQTLRETGLAVRVRSLHQVDGPLLARMQRALFIVSTSGEGDPPDHALPFLRRVMSAAPSLHHLQYGVLALGDRSYGNFCAFGHQLDAWLRQHGAHALFDTVELDNADPATLRHWQQLLGQLGGSASEQPDWSPAQYQPWRLLAREHLNPGSVGGPVYWLRLQPPPGETPPWQAGDIAEVGPRHPVAHVEAWLLRHDIDGSWQDDDGITLAQHLSSAHLPDAPADDPPALLQQLQPLPHREYSIASVMADGALELLLRRQRRADGTPGLASGWLCDHVAVGGIVDLRVRRNPNFHGVSPGTPLLLIGNGTGIAGLRAHLRERASTAGARTWLLFGERTRQHDFHFRSELEQLHREARLERLDTVFSRDGGEHRYVQHRLQAEAERLRHWVHDGATILVCGSLQGMAPAVDAVIEQVLGAQGKEALLLSGRYRRDVY